MSRHGILPEMTSTNPAGYVFWSNHTHEFQGVVFSKELITKLTAEEFKIPEEDVLVLEYAVPGMPFSSFVKEIHETLVSKRKNKLLLMVEMLDLVTSMEEDSDPNQNPDNSDEIVH